MTANNILVVDDGNPGIRELLSEILKDEGYNVKLAENARQRAHRREARRPGFAGYLDARYRWHFAPQGMGNVGSVDHAGRDDVWSRHHRVRD